jgi:hypothetical protein
MEVRVMLQCNECEFGEIKPDGQVVLRCNPFESIKEPECLQKWQLLKLEGIFQAYGATLAQYSRMAPLQEKMMKFMEREMGDMDETEKWKVDYDEEDEDDEPPFDPLEP